MVYLIGRIQKIGGISGKRIYFKEILGGHLRKFWLRGNDFKYHDNLCYGAIHCFDCSPSFIEKALFLHNEDAIVLIRVTDDMVIIMEKIDKEFLMNFLKIKTDCFSPPLDNQLIEEIAKFVLK
jgi:hypothetical protein